MSYRVILAKILPEKYIEDFLDGNLYLNTLSYFSLLDSSDQVRSDPHDGLFESRQVLSAEIQDTDGNWIPIGGIINPVIFRTNETSKFNILCMYSITDRDNDKFDNRNNSFGETAILINNLPEFFSRIRTAAANKDWEITHSPVQYVSRDIHDGYMGPFRKFDEFSYQNEFRFVFKTNLQNSCRLNVGNLRDIVSIIDSNKIQDLWSWLNSRA